MVSTDYPPYFAADLPEGGTLTAIARAALKAEGYKLAVVYRPWEVPEAATKIGPLEPAVETMPLYLGISRKTPDYARVVADFNRGLATIRRNGEYARILKRLPLEAGK